MEGMNKSVVVPFDVKKGMVTGTRHHEPIVVHKRIDQASPLLAKVISNGELVEATIRFYPEQDAEAPYLTIEVSNALIVALRVIAQKGQTYPMESMSLVFQSIRLTWIDRGMSHTDTWAGREQK